MTISADPSGRTGWTTAAAAAAAAAAIGLFQISEVLLQSRGAQVFKDFIAENIGLRIEGDRLGKPALSDMAKLLNNSGYGQ